MLVPLSVSDVMSTDVQTVGPAATIRAVAERLYGSDIGSLVVTEEEMAVGIVTESDLTRLLAAGRDPDVATVREVMSDDLVTVGPEATLEQAARLLREGGFRRLPVLDGEGLAGIVTATDLSAFVPRLTERATTPADPPGLSPDTKYDDHGWEFEAREGRDVGPESGDVGTIDVGDVVRFRKTLDDEDVRRFADASGDTNRLHLDEEFARETRFGRRIVHGTLVGGVVSAALARLPGLTIYLGQDLRYLGPVDVGARVTAVCEVAEALGGERFRLSTAVYDPDGECVVDGEATVLVDELPANADRLVDTSV